MTLTAEQHAERAGHTALNLLAAYQAGLIIKPDLIQQTAQAIYVAKIVATRIADVAIAVLSGFPPVGLVPGSDHRDRLSEAITTLLDTDAEPVERLVRLAEAETLLSHRKSLHAAIREHGFPEWVRVVEEDACNICAPFAGRVYSIDHGFKDHPGCRCTLEPHGEPVRRAPTQTTERAEEPRIRITKEIRRNG